MLRKRVILIEAAITSLVQIISLERKQKVKKKKSRDMPRISEWQKGDEMCLP